MDVRAASESRMSLVCRFVVAAATLHLRRQQAPVEIPKDLDWNEVTEFAEHHGLTPLLCWNLRAYNLSVPKSSALEAHSRIAGAQAVKLSAVLVQVISDLSEHQIPVLAFKGPSLAAILYSNVTLRSYADLDFLFLPEDIKLARIVLQEKGWAAVEDIASIHEESFLRSQCEIGLLRNETLLELQWALAPRFFSLDLPLEAMMRRAVTVEVIGVPVKTLAADDLFLALAVHGAKHLWSRLGWVVDIAALLGSESIDGSRIAGIALQCHLQRIVAVALLMAEKIGDVRIPAELRTLMAQDPQASAMASALFQNAVSGAEQFPPESLAYFGMFAQMRERRMDRVLLFVRLFLTPGSSEWRMVHLPSGARWFYHPIRVLRLAKRLLRGAW